MSRVVMTAQIFTPATAPDLTVGTIGHPANECYIVKGSEGWRYVHSGEMVPSEAFRAGWAVVK